MDIEKTIDYLENVMSSEVRIITLEKEIADMQAILEYHNEYFDYLKEGLFEKIYIPRWLFYSDVFSFAGTHTKYWSYDTAGLYNYLNVKKIGTHEKEYKEYGWRYELRGITYCSTDIEDVGFGKTFSDYVHNNAYFDKASDIVIRMVSAAERMIDEGGIERNAFRTGGEGDYTIETYILVVDCVYRLIIDELHFFLGMTDCFKHKVISESIVRYGQNMDYDCNKYSMTKPTNYLDLSGDATLLVCNFKSYFCSIPERAQVLSSDSFRKTFYDEFRKNRFQLIETSPKKGLFGRETRIVSDKYSDHEVELMSAAVYPYYCELHNAMNDYFINCYNHLVDTCTADAMNKTLALNKLPELKRMLQEEKETLDKLYSLGVIYGKYRSIVPIGSFIDYFASGRCSSFDGPDGAYNLYENELRLDRISDKLDVIIVKLDEIKANQRAMYLALSEMNGTLRALHSAVDQATRDITSSIRAEGAGVRNSISNVSSTINSIASSTAAMSAEQKYSNKLLEISNERQNSIIRNQEFEKLLYTNPSIFGGRAITPKAYGKYH